MHTTYICRYTICSPISFGSAGSLRLTIRGFAVCTDTVGWTGTGPKLPFEKYYWLLMKIQIWLQNCITKICAIPSQFEHTIYIFTFTSGDFSPWKQAMTLQTQWSILISLPYKIYTTSTTTTTFEKSNVSNSPIFPALSSVTDDITMEQVEW